MLKRIKSHFVWKRAFDIKKMLRERQCADTLRKYKEKMHVLMEDGTWIALKCYRAYDPLIFGKSCEVLDNNKCKELKDA
jgi:hypothetical protein